MRTRREDRFDYGDRPYGFSDDDNEDRGWFDRVRDRASRWWRGQDRDERVSERRVWLDEQERRRRFMRDEADRLREARMRDDERRYRDERMFDRHYRDRGPPFDRQRERYGELGRRGEPPPYDRGPRRYDHADERERWRERPRYPPGNAYDQRLAYDRERERFERHRDDHYRFRDDDDIDRDDDGYPRSRRFDPFEHDDVRRGISRFHDRDRRR